MGDARQVCCRCCCRFFFFNDTATTEIYTLSLHDALPIWDLSQYTCATVQQSCRWRGCRCLDRKSTRLNSSHLVISYAVFCLIKQKSKAISGGVSAEAFWWRLFRVSCATH